MPARSVLRVFLCVLLILSSGACARPEIVDAGVPGKSIEALDSSFFPPEIQGLRTAAEDVAATIKESNQAYVEAVGLYSLREGDLLMATVQVSRFSKDAPLNSSRFTRTIVEQAAATQPKEVILDETSVYLARGTRQKSAIWFQDEHFYVLSIRDDFEQPRSLVRSILRLER